MRYFIGILLILLIGQQELLTQPATLKLIYPNGGEVFRAGSSQNLKWDTTGTYRYKFAFQFGTSKTGPWTLLPGLSSVLDSGSRRGKYDGGFRVPAIKSTTGYIRMVLLNADGSMNESVTDVNDNPFTIEQPEATRADSVLRTPITSRVQLTNKKIYSLDGYVFVDAGGVLAIEPGTIIIGDTVGDNSAICVNRGGKIYAKGKKELPIVMTSSAPPGQRRAGDWGGLLVCGNASTNHPGGEAALEGGIADADKNRGWFGGRLTPNDDDSSGVIEYVRIEFAGIAAAPNQELNSLTLGAVGRKTVINHIQVSYANDDAFEWFGGTVNAKYLIAIGTLDDDFDGDNGFSGKIQFGLTQRHAQRADVSTSQSFEMDNDAGGTFNHPLTRPVFSNITTIGPIQDTSWKTGTGDLQFSSRFGAAAQIRRNARTSIFNSVFVGWPRGLDLLSGGSQGAASRDSLRIRNNNWYGVKGKMLQIDGANPAVPEDWLTTQGFENVLDASSPMNAALTNPFDIGLDFNPLPKPTAPYLDNADFSSQGVVPLDDSFFTRVDYRGAFSDAIAERWDLGWSEWDPVNKEYKAVSGIENSNDILPELYYNIIPLPAEDITSVIYKLPSRSIVNINLYDTFGNKVQSIADGIYQSENYYQFNLELSGLQCGTYILSIVSEAGSATIKIPLIR